MLSAATSSHNKCIPAFQTQPLSDSAPILDSSPKMKKKTRKRPDSHAHAKLFRALVRVPSVLTPMAATTVIAFLLLVISSVFISHVESVSVNTGIDAHVGAFDFDDSDSSSDSIQSSSELPSQSPPPAPLPPLIYKCCPFDSHYELAPGGREGRCVPIGDPSHAHASEDTSAPPRPGIRTEINEHGHSVWPVPTFAPVFLDHGEEPTVPDAEDTQSTTMMEDGLEAEPDLVRGNRTSRSEESGFNITDIAEVLSGGGPAPVTFRLEVSQPKCSSINLVRKIIHRSKLAQRSSEHNESPPPPPPSPSPDYNSTVEDFNATYPPEEGPEPNFTLLTSDGSLMWVDEKGMMNTRQNQDFCIDQLDEENYIALICKPLCNDLSPCIRKCCPPESILDLANERCVKAKKPWVPYLYTTAYNQVSGSGKPSRHQSQDYHYTYGIPASCNTYLISLREDPLDKMYALVNGSLMTVNRGHKLIHHPETYCIDGTINHEPGGEEIIFGPDHEPVHYSGSELDQVAIVCIPQPAADKPLPWRFTLFAVTSFITAFFLFLTAIVYIILWEQQNIHGWLQFAYVASCLQSYTCLGILQLKSEDIITHSPKLCEAMGSVIHFSFLSAFFWMTCMNFDLWWTFRYMSGCSPMRPRSKTGEMKRFFSFALFAWGSSGIIAGTGLVLDHLYRDDPDSTVIRPHFGENFCYFDNNEGQLYYFYAPVGVLLLINLVFFFSTVFSLHRLQKVTKFATEQSSKSEKRKFLLFLKLFVVMGVLWIFEVISWAVQASVSEHPVKTEFWLKVFLPTDILNSSQGVLIFIIFTCKTNTCRQIEGQLKKFSLFLQQNRDKGYGSTIWSHVKGALVVILASFTLPIVHMLRIVLNHFGRVCGRRVAAGDTSGKTISSNATTVTTSSMFDKSRKVSDCSVTTTISSVPPGGDGHHSHHYPTSSSNSSSITNIEMDMTSLVSLKT